MTPKAENPTKSISAHKGIHDHLINKVQEHGSLLILVFLLMWNILIFGDIKRAKKNLFDPDEEYITYMNVVFFLFGGILYNCIVILIRYFLSDRLDDLIDNSKINKNESYEIRKERIIGYIQGVVYHGLYFTSLFIGLRGTEFMPRAFGGESDVAAQYQRYPINVPGYLKAFYMFSMGYSTLKLIKVLIYGRHNKDFMQNIMHHYITISLIGYSFLTKHFISGFPVLLLHASTDSVAYMTRLFRELKHLKGFPLYIVYSLFLASWIYSRIVSYHVEVYWPYAIVLIRLSHEYFYISLYILFCCTALSFLNFLWLLQILRALVLRMFKKST